MGHCANGLYAISVPPIQAPGLKEALGRRSVIQPHIMSAVHGLGRLFGDEADKTSLGIALCRKAIITRVKGSNIVPVIAVQCSMWTVVDQNLKAHVALLVGSHKDTGVGRVVSPRLYLKFKVGECLFSCKIGPDLRLAWPPIIIPFATVQIPRLGFASSRGCGFQPVSEWPSKSGLNPSSRRAGTIVVVACEAAAASPRSRGRDSKRPAEDARLRKPRRPGSHSHVSITLHPFKLC